MRITAGKYKGARLETPKTRGMRPTSARVKESLFAILRGRINGADALDICAGSGAVGIEALSRGARRCVFVDADPAACRCIRRNLAALNAPPDAAQTLRAKASSAARRLFQQNRLFQIVFLDPPYNSPILHDMLRIIGQSAQICAQDGIVAAEHRANNAPDDRYGNLKRTRMETYGDTQLSFFEPSESERAL